MKGNFGNCLKLVLGHEGGYVNHPKDPGGSTNFGITQGTYNSWRDRHGLARQSVKYIATHDLHSIYRQDYWKPVEGDYIPLGLDYTVFDASVNSGIGRGPKWTQRALGVTADSKIGPITLERMGELDEEGLVKVIKLANAKRLGFLKGLSHWSTFGRGWARRVAEVEAGSIGMAAGSHKLREESAKAKRAASAEAGGGASTAVGGAATSSLDLPVIVQYGVYALLAVVVIIVAKRALSHMERAFTMRKVADQLDQLED